MNICLLFLQELLRHPSLQLHVQPAMASYLSPFSASFPHPIDSFPFTSFQEEQRRMFDHPLRREVNSAKRLLNLRQGNRSVAEFVIDFRILAAETGWPPSALQGVLLNASNNQLKDQLASREEPSSFKDLTNMAICIDNRIAERMRGRGSPVPFSHSLGGLPT